MTYRSNKDEAAAVVDAVIVAGRRAAALELDTTRIDTFPAFAATLQDVLGTWERDTFDFLVNNAGVAAPVPVGETTAEAFDLLVNVHFKGVFFLTQTLLPILADGGRIINVPTGLTRFVGEDWSVYASMKTAIETYTKYLAKELGGRGITVDAVAPGPVATDFGGGAIRDNEQVRAPLSGQAALGRVAEPRTSAPSSRRCWRRAPASSPPSASKPPAAPCCNPTSQAPHTCIILESRLAAPRTRETNHHEQARTDRS
ncbi:hypothetical protein SUDANB132_00187 [Streptomyces sp. enrichment culture]